MEKRNKSWKNVGKRMGNVLSALSILFVLHAFARIDFGKIQVTNTRWLVAVCLLGLLVKLFTVPCMGFAWLLWLEAFLGRQCKRLEALHVYLKANIGKYMPGNVMHYVERNLFATNLGLPQTRIAAASLLEIVCLLLAGLVFGGAFLKNVGWMVVCGLVCVCAVAFVVVGIVWRSFRSPVVQRVFRTFFACFAIYGMVLVLLGFVLLLLYCYEQGRPVGFWIGIRIVSAYILAWVAGFVVPGAPGGMGMGVRELVLLLLLAPMMGEDTIVSLCVLHRLITVAGDLLMYFLDSIFYKG